MKGTKMYMECVEIDVTGLAGKLVDMVIEIDMEGPLAFGMLPAVLMDALQKQMDTKFPSTMLAVGDTILYHDEVVSMKKEIMHDISVEMYQIAGARGLMVV